MKVKLLLRERRVLEIGFIEVAFESVDQLLDDFLRDVARWKGK
jgi:hypothetical protein